LEVRVGNVETETGGRQVFGAVARADTDIVDLIRWNLTAVGRTGDTELTVSSMDASVSGPYWPPLASPSHRFLD
jgi:hypothetical protein